jgi:hypothetical protein
MKKILLQTSSPGLANNQIFKKDINGISDSWILLKQKLAEKGYNLMTADDHDLTDCAKIIFCDASSLGEYPTLLKKIKNGIRKILRIKIYPSYPTRHLYEEGLAAGLHSHMLLVVWEARSVIPQNFSKDILDKFKHIITWDDDQLVDPKFSRYWKPMETPRPLSVAVPFNEKKLLVNISFNKYSKYKHELYSERRKLSSYFEKHFPNDFDLYGLRWNRPITRLQQMFPFLVKKYTTFRGHSEDKIATLSKYKFNVAYENISDAKGYIADRIFSAFQARSVPIYWGAPNIEEYIDADTFVDRRKFKNNAELAKFLSEMSEEEYNKYLVAADRFMKSPKYAKFLAPDFVDQVIKALHI